MRTFIMFGGIALVMLLSGCGGGGGSSFGGNNAPSFESQFDAAQAAPITLESAGAVSDFIANSHIVDNETAALGLSSALDHRNDVNGESYMQLPLTLIMQDSAAAESAALSPSRSGSSFSDIACDSGSVAITPTAGDNPYPDRIDASFNSCVKYGMTLDGKMAIDLHGNGQTVTSECVKYTSDFTIDKNDQLAKIRQGSNICVKHTVAGYRTRTVAIVERGGKIYGTKNLVTEVDTKSTPGQVSLLFKSGLIYINNLANWLWISPEKAQLPFIINSEGKLLSGTSNVCNRKSAFINIEVYSVDLIKASVDANNDGEYEKSKFIVLSDTITRTFFGDKENNRVVVAEVETMSLADPYEVYTGHLITYTADKVYDHPKVYVVNRGSDAIDVMDVNTIEITKTIPLVHYPRSSEQMNKTLRLNETSGMNKAMASIIDIDTDEVVAAVGNTTPVDTDKNPNYGGSHATGHPFWLDAHHFALLDRYDRKVVTYHIEKDSNDEWVTTKLSEVPTTTSIHQIVPSKGNYQGKPGFFYGTAEGAPDIYPSIIEFELVPGTGLVQRRELQLKKDGVDVNSMWLHHGDFHPTEPLMYVGSGDGTLFIVNYETMTIAKTIQAGAGAGHTVMIPKKNLAVVINHKDVFVTIIDTETNEKIADVRVSDHDEWVGTATIQAHPKFHVSPDAKYFYAYLTEEGVLYEMSLDTLEVTRKLSVGGKPAQGSFVKVAK